MTIVNINVSVLNPPKPSRLLQTGAIVSVGATTLAAGATQLLTNVDDLADILTPAQSIDSVAWAQGVATITTDDALNLTTGDNINVTISGMVPAAYNGSFVGTVTGANSVTVAIAQDPGEATTIGTINLASVDELQAYNTSFWAQGKQRSVYVLELGRLPTAEAITALKTFVDSDVSLGLVYQQFFAYLVPLAFSTQAAFRTMASEHLGNADAVYFFVTTDLQNYAQLAATKYKSIYAVIDSPDTPDTHLDAAAQFQSALSNAPSATNKVPPMSYRYGFGVTAYPIRGNSATLALLEAANVNYIGSAAEGGLSNMIFQKGYTLDGQPFNYWYSIAWTIINLQLNLANEIILGSNNSANPLYYDQDGVDRLQKRALNTLRTGISYGLLLGTVLTQKLSQNDFNENYNNGDYNGLATVNAVPFSEWVTNDPSEYEQQHYGGLSAVVTPRRGFLSITFNLNVTNFAG